MAAVGSELTRAPEIVKGRFEVQLELLLRDLTSRSGASREAALAQVALCVGAMTLARAQLTDARADEMLQAARAGARALSMST